ncbi:MAG: hypothetical protein AAGH74_06960 [Pseudomonadota bacterium]
MLTEGDKAMYYDAGRNYRGTGIIVDAGCFVGGTTIHLVNGLLHNDRFGPDDPRLAKIINVYDLFMIDIDYILEDLEKNYPDREFAMDESFQAVFEDNLSEHQGMIDLKPGDVTKYTHPKDKPIEILGIDLCKALPITDHVVRSFFPSLIEDALVIHQDFMHEFHPHIHLSMMRLRAFFTPEIELPWGCSVSYRLKRKISDQDILAAFGSDTSWYSDVATNTALLDDLHDEMLHDQIKFYILLTKAWYFAQQQDMEQARAAYNQAIEAHPNIPPTPATKRRFAES